jgi:hypothetical protein
MAMERQTKFVFLAVACVLAVYFPAALWVSIRSLN